MQRAKLFCGGKPPKNLDVSSVYTPLNKRKTPTEDMGGWFLLEEKTIIKVWTLFLFQWGAKHEQQALKAAIDATVEACFKLVEVIKN